MATYERFFDRDYKIIILRWKLVGSLGWRSSVQKRIREVSLITRLVLSSASNNAERLSFLYDVLYNTGQAEIRLGKERESPRIVCGDCHDCGVEKVAHSTGFAHFTGNGATVTSEVNARTRVDRTILLRTIAPFSVS